MFTDSVSLKPTELQFQLSWQIAPTESQVANALLPAVRQQGGLWAREGDGTYRAVGHGCTMRTWVTKAIGPSIYNADSETIAASDPEELNRVKQNFLIKKLGLKDGPDLDKALEEVITAIGKYNKNKYRVLVYALLAKKFKKESVYQ